MKKLADPTKDEETALEVRPSDLLTVITAAVANPDLDVEKMKALLDMHMQITAEQRRIAFMEAMARLATKLPEIDQNGRVKFDGKEGKQGQDRKYARLEDIDRAIRPLLSEEGFSLSFDTGEGQGGKIRVSCKLSHSAGHSETKQLDLPHDPSGSKNGVQAVGSTVSYGRRMLVKMFFNLMEKGEDTDGESLQPITAEQAKDIEALISEVGADKKRFLAYMESERVDAILAKDHKKAITALESKRRK